jgi:hypothetical protein
MKLYTSFSLVILITGSISIEAPPDTLWTKIFGGNKSGGCDYSGDAGRALEETEVGGYVISGWTNSYSDSGSDVWLVGTDHHGNEIWSHAFGGEGDEASYDIIKTLDGGFFIAGIKDDDLWLICTNQLGDTLWSRQYHDSIRCKVNEIKVLPDGGCIIVGSKGIKMSEQDIWLSRTTFWGEMLWTRTYGGEGWQEGWSVEISDFHEYIVIGTTESPKEDTHKIILFSIDESGDSLWSRTYQTGSWSEGRAVLYTDDGGFIILGVTELWISKPEYKTLLPPSYSAYLKKKSMDIRLSKEDNYSDIQNIYKDLIHNNSEINKYHRKDIWRYNILIDNRMAIQERDAWIIKTDEWGNILNSNIIGGPGWDDVFSISPTSDGGYIVAGEKYVEKSETQDFWLIRGNANGDTLWTTTTGDSVDEIAYDAKQTLDNGYIVTGIKHNREFSTDQMWLVRFGQEVNSIDMKVTDFPEKYALDQNYPNPFNSLTIINYHLPRTIDVDLSVYNLLGQKVSTLVSEKKNSGIHQVKWNASEMASGLYFYILQAGKEFAETKKMLLIH